MKFKKIFTRRNTVNFFFKNCKKQKKELKKNSNFDRCKIFFHGSGTYSILERIHIKIVWYNNFETFKYIYDKNYIFIRSVLLLEIYDRFYGYIWILFTNIISCAITISCFLSYILFPTHFHQLNSSYAITRFSQPGNSLSMQWNRPKKKKREMEKITTKRT